MSQLRKGSTKWLSSLFCLNPNIVISLPVFEYIYYRNVTDYYRPSPAPVDPESPGHETNPNTDGYSLLQQYYRYDSSHMDQVRMRQLLLVMLHLAIKQIPASYVTMASSIQPGLNFTVATLQVGPQTFPTSTVRVVTLTTELCDDNASTPASIAVMKEPFAILSLRKSSLTCSPDQQAFNAQRYGAQFWLKEDQPVPGLESNLQYIMRPNVWSQQLHIPLLLLPSRYGFLDIANVLSFHQQTNLVLTLTCCDANPWRDALWQTLFPSMMVLEAIQLLGLIYTIHKLSQFLANGHSFARPSVAILVLTSHCVGFVLRIVSAVDLGGILGLITFGPARFVLVLSLPLLAVTTIVTGFYWSDMRDNTDNMKKKVSSSDTTRYRWIYFALFVVFVGGSAVVNILAIVFGNSDILTSVFGLVVTAVLLLSVFFYMYHGLALYRALHAQKVAEEKGLRIVWHVCLGALFMLVGVAASIIFVLQNTPALFVIGAVTYSYAITLLSLVQIHAITSPPSAKMRHASDMGMPPAAGAYDPKAVRLAGRNRQSSGADFDKSSPPGSLKAMRTKEEKSMTELPERV